MSVAAERIALVLAGIDAWLEGMRGPDGYTGPIAHWWETNLRFTGPIFDWRYEGIIDGYRTLYLKTGNPGFLHRAERAADDVLAAQLPDGRFSSSSFQFGPVPGGTPHEAGIDAALLLLAKTMRQQDLNGYERYQASAQANLEQYWFGVLWDGRGFMDQPYNPVLVANKHATLLEALLVYGELLGRSFEEYTAACLRVIRSAYVPSGPQAGGIVHLGIGPSRLAVSIYTARTMNGVLSYYLHDGDPSLPPFLQGAVSFLEKLLTSSGVAWGVYGSGETALNPQMIAGAGDVLRFLLRAAAAGIDTGTVADRLGRTLLVSQLPSGGLPTARGFVAKGLARSPRTVELRDILPVAGWVDKTFRALTAWLPEGSQLPAAVVRPYGVKVAWRGRVVEFREDGAQFEVIDQRGKPVYVWRKGTRAPQICEV